MERKSLGCVPLYISSLWIVTVSHKFVSYIYIRKAAIASFSKYPTVLFDIHELAVMISIEHDLYNIYMSIQL